MLPARPPVCPPVRPLLALIGALSLNGSVALALTAPDMSAAAVPSCPVAAGGGAVCALPLTAAGQIAVEVPAEGSGPGLGSARGSCPGAGAGAGAGPRSRPFGARREVIPAQAGRRG